MKGLEAHYGKLSPRERVALISAAWMRDDDAEAKRLIDTAPIKIYEVPEHLILGNALRQIELAYLTHQLDTAVTFWRTLGMAESLADDDRTLRLMAGAKALAYRLVQGADGWALFCAGLGIPAPGNIVTAPGYENVAQTLETAQLIAFTREEMLAWLEARSVVEGVTVAPQGLSPEESAAGWRMVLEALS